MFLPEGLLDISHHPLLPCSPVPHAVYTTTLLLSTVLYQHILHINHSPRAPFHSPFTSLVQLSHSHGPRIEHRIRYTAHKEHRRKKEIRNSCARQVVRTSKRGNLDHLVYLHLDLLPNYNYSIIISRWIAHSPTRRDLHLDVQAAQLEEERN